jgi:hypothetical protein
MERNQLVFIGKTEGGANMYLGRRNSGGLKATYENVRHHAKYTEPFIDAVLPTIKLLPIRNIYLFNNSWHLEMFDGREYIIKGHDLGPQGMAHARYDGLELLTGAAKVAARESLMVLNSPMDIGKFLNKIASLCVTRQ